MAGRVGSPEAVAATSMTSVPHCKVISLQSHPGCDFHLWFKETHTCLAGVVGKCPNPALHITGKMDISCSVQGKCSNPALSTLGKYPNPALSSTGKMPKSYPAQHRENTQIALHSTGKMPTSYPAQGKCSDTALPRGNARIIPCTAQYRENAHLLPCRVQGKCPDPALPSTVHVRTAMLAAPAPHSAQTHLTQHTHHINSGLVCLLPEKSKQHRVQSEMKAEPIPTNGEMGSPSSPLGHITAPLRTKQSWECTRQGEGSWRTEEPALRTRHRATTTRRERSRKRHTGEADHCEMLTPVSCEFDRTPTGREKTRKRETR